jgi:hypothetical protein
MSRSYEKRLSDTQDRGVCKANAVDLLGGLSLDDRRVSASIDQLEPLISRLSLSKGITINSGIPSIPTR